MFNEGTLKSKGLKPAGSKRRTSSRDSQRSVSTRSSRSGASGRSYTSVTRAVGIIRAEKRAAVRDLEINRELFNLEVTKDRLIAEAQATAKMRELELKSLQMQERLDLSELKLKIENQEGDDLDGSLDDMTRDLAPLIKEPSKPQEPIMINVNPPPASSNLPIASGDIGTLKTPSVSKTSLVTQHLPNPVPPCTIRHTRSSPNVIVFSAINV